MAFGGKVDDRAWSVLGQQARHQGAVANVALHEQVARIALQPRQRFQVARVGQLVEVDDALLRVRQPVENEVGADEASASGDENSHRVNLFITRQLTDELNF